MSARVVTFGPPRRGLCTVNFPQMCPGRRWGRTVYIDGQWTCSFTCENEAHVADVVTWAVEHGNATGVEGWYPRPGGSRRGGGGGGMSADRFEAATGAATEGRT